MPGSDATAGGAVLSEPGMEELVGELLDENERSQELSEQRKSVLDQSGEDFSGNKKEKLKEIKNTEKKVAERMREIVQDMSQVGNLNTSNATEVSNEQQIRENAENLAEVNEKKAEQEITQITDNLDTAAQELHEELEKQSEMSFGDSSSIQDVQEIAEDKKTPLPMAELPQTLNDLVGKMENLQKEFDEKAQTKGSMLKSLDADGPIAPGRQSSTSAEGKTGDEPPDAARETEGRSGFGRTGRASGEGVANVAEDIPQDKVVPPERNTGTSLEKGGVEDRSTEAQAGGTGLGKETNRTGEFGLDGELPDTILDRMRKTAGQMKKLRENVSGVVMDLQRYNLSTTRLEEAAEAMDRVVQAAEDGNFVKFRRSYNQALDQLSESEETIGQKVGKRLIRERKHAEAVGSSREREYSIPGEYEKMVSEYFRRIAREDDQNER
jgi:polyhydroxyalkanoate synthesis regulator phasin